MLLKSTGSMVYCVEIVVIATCSSCTTERPRRKWPLQNEREVFFAYMRIITLFIIISMAFIYSRRSSDDRPLRAPRHSTVAATAFSTQATLIETGPVTFRVICRDLAAYLNAFTHQDDALRALPDKVLKLRVWVAAVVDEARVVPLPSLPYLIGPHPRRRIHDVEILDALCYESDKLPNSHAALHGRQCQQPVVSPILCPKHLHRGWSAPAGAKQRWETATLVVFWIIRLRLAAGMAVGQRRRNVDGWNIARVVPMPRERVDN